MAASTDADGRSCATLEGMAGRSGPPDQHGGTASCRRVSQERSSVMLVLFARATGVISHQAVPSSADFCMT